MKKVLLKIVLFFYKYDLRINTKYQFKIEITESNHSELQVGMEIALIDIDTRLSTAKIVLHELFQLKEDSFLFHVRFLLEKFCSSIENGSVSLDYLILNSGKDIELIKTLSDDGVQYINPRSHEKDYWIWQKISDSEGNPVLDESGEETHYEIKYKVTDTNEWTHL